MTEQEFIQYIVDQKILFPEIFETKSYVKRDNIDLYDIFILAKLAEYPLTNLTIFKTTGVNYSDLKSYTDKLISKRLLEQI